RFDEHVSNFRPITDAPEVLVVETLSGNPRSYSSNDPRRIWWVSAGGEKTLLRGPERSLSLSPSAEALSPDGRFVALSAWRQREGGREGEGDTVVVYADREAGTEQVVAIPGASLYHLGWQGKGARLRAVL